MKDIPIKEVIGMRTEEGKISYCDDYNISNLIKYSNVDYRDWAILCTTNAVVKTTMDFLDKNKIPNVTFKQGQAHNSAQELRQKIKENSVKVLTVHAAKGLEWPKVMVKSKNIWGKPYWSRDEKEAKRVEYVAATRARDELYIIV